MCILVHLLLRVPITKHSVTVTPNCQSLMEFKEKEDLLPVARSYAAHLSDEAWRK